MAEFSLRFSAPDWCFFKPGMEPRTYYRQLRDLGIEAAEMVAPERRTAARDAGLSLLNLSGPGMQEGLNDRRHHPALIDRIRSCIAEAAREDIAHVIVFSGNRSPEVTDGPAACAEALEQVLPDAETAGVTLVFEMLNAFDHPGYEGDHSAYGFDLAARFDSPHLSVLLDLYHMQRMGEDPAALIQTHHNYIAHLHIAGSPGRDCFDTEQEIDLAGCIRAAREVGYEGCWGLEFVPADGQEIEELSRSVAVMRKLAEGCCCT